MMYFLNLRVLEDGRTRDIEVPIDKETADTITERVFRWAGEKQVDSIRVDSITSVDEDEWDDR